MITENLSTLKIHKLTQEQYDRELEAGNIDSSAIYLTPDEDIDIYVQNDEPTEAEEGALWVDMDELGDAFEDYATKTYVTTKIAEAQLSGGDIDLTGYATEQYVKDYAQPKGEYLKSSELPNAVNTALAEAKASGAFDGADGQDGYTPQKGIDYFDGQPGKDGVDGKDGYTPVKGVDYFDGSPGKDGKDGNPGADGYTPVKGKDYFDGEDGKDGSPGKDGADGKTPVKGVDYFTEADKSEMVNLVLAALPVAEGVLF